MIEAWRKVWRDGIAPQLSSAALEVLGRALEEDDPQLVQGATTEPPPLQMAEAWPVEGACPVGYCGWQVLELGTVGQVVEFFADVCHAADQQLGEPAAVRWFLNWWDDSPRHFARLLLLAEVEGELARRSGKAGAA
jgi:hypothetical protein